MVVGEEPPVAVFRETFASKHTIATRVGCEEIAIAGERRLWVIADPLLILKISGLLAEMPAFYIADGHHRSASSALLGKSKRERNPRSKGKEPWNYYLGIFLSESQLRIYDFNRVVKDLNGLTEEQFLKSLEFDFELKTLSSRFAARVKHQFGMYLSGKWYALKLKKEKRSKGPVESLDAEILTRRILAPLLGIENLKTDKRIAFVSGVKVIL